MKTAVDAYPLPTKWVLMQLTRLVSRGTDFLESVHLVSKERSAAECAFVSTRFKLHPAHNITIVRVALVSPVGVVPDAADIQLQTDLIFLSKVVEQWNEL